MTGTVGALHSAAGPHSQAVVLGGSLDQVVLVALGLSH